MKLNDDELLEAGFQAIHRFAPRPVSITLLRILMRYAPEPIFFEETISPALEDGNEGVMAMLYLATRRGKSFFHRIDPTLIFGFCRRVAEAEELLSPKWYYGVKLLYNLFENTPSSEWKYSTLLPYLLSNVCSGIIKQGQVGPKPSAVEELRRSSAFREPWLLPLVSMCFEQLDDYPVTFPAPSTLKVFLELLISIVQPEDNSLRHLNTNRGWALRNLISLLEFPTPLTLISHDMLQRIGDLLTDIALHPYNLEVQGVEVFEKDILRHFASNLDEWSVEGLCCLPESTFITALSSALKRRTLQLDSTGSNPYEPLSTVERLLWLSNKGSPYADSQRIHRVLVNSGACGFLVHVLSHSGALAPQDRGLWRAKGLAVTCLGNLMEHMNEEQCRNSIAKDTIDAVVAIKEDKEVPLAQKGQAIFTLQRYIKAVERWGIQPYYPENVLGLS